MKSPVLTFHRAASLVSRILSVIVLPLVLLTILAMTGCAKNLSPGTSKEILVKFNPGVQTAQVNALESEAGLEQIKVIPELDVRVYMITSSKSVTEVIAICEGKSFVKYAEPNYKYGTLKD